ncbi:MAG: hypothetical protein QG622_3325 [Actinomycetota bacterium]|nr:hypothetical protein [Actinomycetota bacterium]
MSDQPRRRGAGRPRDPGLESRALAAALQVFGERGWSGMTIDEVATTAGVGKSSLYLRWKNKTELLADALGQVLLPPGAATLHRDTEEEGSGGDDTAPEPSLRDFLITHALWRAHLYLGPHRLAVLRFYVETWALPGVFGEIRQHSITDWVLRERHRVDRATRDGELPPGASPVHLLDAIEGAVFVHALVTPPHLLDRVRSGLREYVERLVDDQLRAASTAPDPTPAAPPATHP